MNGSGDIPLTYQSSTPDARPCSLVSIIPTLGMSSCRGRAEAFARRLSSKLRTLGSQTDDEPISPEVEPIINGGSTNTWMTSHESAQAVTDLQPLRHESDSFFDFDCELESPGSPVDECEYLRLIETASNTPHNSVTESGYVCASAASSHSSSDGPYFDVVNSEVTVTTEEPPPTKVSISELPEYVNSLKLNDTAERLTNGLSDHSDESSEKSSAIECAEDNSQTHIHTIETTKELPTTGPDVVANHKNHAGNRILSPKEMVKVQDQIISELQKQSEQFVGASAPIMENGHCESTEEEVVTPTEANSSVEAFSLTKFAVPSESVVFTGSVTSTESVTSAELVTSAEVVTSAEPLTSAELVTSAEPLTSAEPVTSAEPLTSAYPVITAESVPSPEVPIEVQSAPEIVHTITNGHADNGEEVLKIEVAEIIQNHSTQTEPSELAQLKITANVPADVSNGNLNSSANSENTAKPPAQESAHLSGLDTTDDEDECRPQRVRRCSSLKTGKTPPGTPGRKKIVRFADVLGLDLADVKTFLDEIPTIPKSAFEDLEFMESEMPMQLGPKSDKLLMPLFQQPAGLPTFLDLVREKQVLLENAAVTDTINQTITGSVRVRNLDFHKSVHIRYTLDGWRSYADLQANYAQNSCDGFSDKFTFIIFGNSLQIGQRLEFAVRFQCKGQQFWDSNYGTNYCFQCLPSSSPMAHPIQQIAPQRSSTTSHMIGPMSPSVGEAWCSSFY